PGAQTALCAGYRMRCVAAAGAWTKRVVISRPPGRTRRPLWAAVAVGRKRFSRAPNRTGRGTALVERRTATSSECGQSRRGLLDFDGSAGAFELGLGGLGGLLVDL